MTLYDLIINENRGVIELNYGRTTTLEDKIGHITNRAKYSGMLALFVTLEQHYPELYQHVKDIDAEFVLDMLNLTIKSHTGDTQRL